MNIISKLNSIKIKFLRVQAKFFSKLKTDKKLRNQLLGGGIILFSGQYYFRHTYSRKAKGLDKLSSIYRPNESEEEMIIFKGSTMELIFDDPSLPAGILFPKRMMSLLKMVQMCNKYGLGVINKDVDDIYLENDKYIEKQFIVINQKKMKDFEIDTDQETITVGPGWKINSLNEKLAEYGYYIPLNPYLIHKRIFEIFNEDTGILDYPQFSENFTDFKHLIQECTMVLPEGKTLVTNNKKMGPGQYFTGLFCGSQASYGILGEIKLKIMPIENNIQKEKFFFSKNISFNELNELLKPILSLQNKELLGNVLIKQTEKYTKVEIAQKDIAEKAYSPQNKLNYYGNWKDKFKYFSSAVLQNNQKEDLLYFKNTQNKEQVSNRQNESQAMSKFNSNSENQQIKKNQKQQPSKQQIKQFKEIFELYFKCPRNQAIIDLLHQKCQKYIKEQLNSDQIVHIFTGMDKYKRLISPFKKVQNQCNMATIDNTLHLRLDQSDHLQVICQIQEIIKEYQENNKIKNFDIHWRYYPKSTDLFIDLIQYQENKIEEINKSQVKSILEQKNIQTQRDQKFQFFKQITNVVTNNQGQFVRCQDSEMNQVIGQLARLYQFGQNNTDLQLYLKKCLDPNKIFLSTNLWHPSFRPQFGKLDQIFNFL